MRWSRHIHDTCSKANRVLGFVRRNVKVRSPRIKAQLYKSLVRSRVEYASSIWAPHDAKAIKQVEMVQRRAARWTLNRHHNTSSVSRMLDDLQWRSLEQRRTDSRLCLIFSLVHGLLQIPHTQYLQPAHTTTTRKNHNLTYQQFQARTDYFKYSFFPSTIIIWNNLPSQLVHSTSINSFRAQVSQLEHHRV